MCSATSCRPRPALPLAGLLILALAGGVSPAHAGINFWTPLGPDGGGISLLAASPVRPGLLFAATCGGSIYRSDNGGASWTPASRGLNIGSGLNPCPFTPFSTLLPDPLNPAVVYAVTQGALWRSNNGGTSWARLVFSQAIYTFTTPMLAVDPRSPATLYLSSANGLWKSTDGGANWFTLPTGGKDRHFVSIAIVPGRPATVYAATTSRLLRSADAGTTWTERDSGLQLAVDGFSCQQLAVDSVAGEVYCASSYPGAGTVYRSGDAGKTWHLAGSAGYPLAIGQGVVYAGGQKSMDGGNTWTAIAAPPGGPVLTLAAGSGTTVYAGTSQQGVFKSDDSATTWQPASTGPGATQIQTLAIDPVHPRILYAGVVDGSAGGGLFRSGNNGRSWQLVLDDTFVGPAFLPPYLGVIAVDPVTPTTAFGLAQSLDGGSTWSFLVQTCDVSKSATCFSVRQLAIDPSNPATLYVSVNREVGVSTTCPAWKSTDRGQTWSCLAAGEQEVAGIFVAAARPATLYAITTPAGCCYNGLSRSTDAGLTWTNLDAPLHYFSVSDVAIDPTTPTASS
jgi:photosystem II stability/assembly factor-like uncharacterized protein